MRYTVTFELDVPCAESAEDAARRADQLIREPEALPPVVTVTAEDGTSEDVDMMDALYLRPLP
jgi:hypothetical protein